MQKYKSLVLPIAIVIGLLGHSLWGKMLPVVPYVIFSILTFAFASIDLRKLRPTKLDLWLVAFQAVVSIALYWLGSKVFGNEIVGEGLMMGVLCPVASSVTVVAAMLGAARKRTISYTIVGNLLVSLIAPVYISLTEHHSNVNMFEAMFTIFTHIASVIALPFFLVLFIQLFIPRVSAFLGRYNGISFYLWAIALLLTLGNTIDFIFKDGGKHTMMIVTLAALSIPVCILQFGVGRLIGSRFGDYVAGGQCLGQKNTAMGIWITNSYLDPLASVLTACYSVCQNLWNSWQIYRSSTHKVELMVRKATEADMDDMLDMFATAKKFMVDHGNRSQWQGEYPSRHLLLNDIAQGQSFMVVDRRGQKMGTFYFHLGEDPTYNIIDGNWPDNEPYGTIHRIASAGRVRGVADAALEHCLNMTPNVRVDTHADNKIMRHWAESRGFKYCGIITIADGSPRMAFHKKK